MDTYDVVIVGAGHGGAQTAVALRQAKFAGSIALIGDEADPPYDRPALSKDYLAGAKDFERIMIRPSSFWSDRDVALRLGERIVSVDPDAHRLVSDAGTVIGYRQLVWAAGGTPRRLSCPGGDLPGVHSVRSRADIDRLTAELPGVERVVVIGGGYVGLEAAAVLTKLGKRVTLIEALDRVLARVAGETLSRFYEAEHRAHGVNIRLGARVERLTGRDDRVEGVVLADGETVPADLVIVGVGIEPVVQPLLAAGAIGGNGVAVDGQCRTSLPDIYAIGDCALHENRYAPGAAIRLESVQNANDQAGVVARAIVGEHGEYEALPWFWSNQYDLKLQTAGLSTGHDATVVRGDPATRSFSIVYLRDGQVIALDCVNAVKDYVQGRKLVESHARADPRSLADPQVALKELA